MDIGVAAGGTAAPGTYIFSYLLKVLELRDLYILVRACVRPEIRGSQKLTLSHCKIEISENHPCKKQYLASVTIKKTS